MHKTWLILLLLISNLAHANEPGIYFWDNQEHFVAGENCTVIPEEQNPFRVAHNEAGVSLLGEEGNTLSTLPHNSLVKLTEQDGLKPENSLNIEVVGLNSESSVSESARTQRGDVGFISALNLRPMDDYTFVLTKDAIDVEIGSGLLSTRATVWQLVSDTSYYRLKCRNMSSTRHYLLFRILVADNKHTPRAYVGVSLHETEILEHIATLNLDRSQYIFRNLMQNRPLIEALRNSRVEVENEVQDTFNDPDADALGSMNETFSDPEKELLDTRLMICTQQRNGTVNIREENLTDIKFRANLGEVVTVFQDFEEENSRTREIGGRTYTFIRVSFIEREESDQTEGWVAQSFVKRGSDCLAYNRYHRGNIVTEDNDPDRITSITDSDCCEFPLNNRPTHPYTSGMRRFEANRSGGRRKHAACDLYRFINEPAVAIASGTVISNLYYFYQGTYAVEIEHPGGYIARYGEITGRRATGIRPGLEVTKGQRVGFIGRVNSGCCRPMLHFELYAGTMEGDLTDSSESIFQRREDLLDPTNFLLRWQEMKF